MSYTLVICEKPKAAAKIAYALSDAKFTKKAIAGVPYFEIEHSGKKIVVASAVGHIFGLQELKKTSKWPVFDIKWEPNESYAKKYLNVLKKLSQDASDYILACDYDVEGEVIGYNVLRFVCEQKDAKRMKFSTLTKPDLLKSYEELEKHVNFGQAFAGETRHYLDWFYGINLSRALMEAIKSAGQFKVLSIGRVQGPALAFIVKREKEIMKFKPTPYWNVYLLINDVKFKYKDEVKKKKDAEKFLDYKGKKVKVDTKKEEIELPPWPPFDLTSLQMESYKYFRLRPAQTLAVAQKLYLAGLISYPRTSSQKLPPTLGLHRILDKLGKNFKKLTKFVKKKWPRQGGKTDPAHPAIYPTGEFKKLIGNEKKIYELIVKRFIACFAENALIENKRLTAAKDFFANGKKVLKKNWLEVYPAKLDLKDLPDLNGNYKVDDVELERKETQPPRRYSPASILSELEKKRLGTKATRADILDRLYKRGYVAGMQIRATPLGISIVDSLEKKCPLILDEKLTRSFEDEMEKIRAEKSNTKIVKEKDKVLSAAKKTLIKIAKEFKKKEAEIGKMLLEGKKTSDNENLKANTLCGCPKCKKGKLIMMRSKRGKRFAFCTNEKCDFSIPLPALGMIKVSDEKCSCGLPKMILIKKGKPPWKFCSLCFTNEK
ncbi:MAG: DNA topoisomerase I [archaeon]|nr:MAG: DNA topoisomerase I [archaeon]